MANLEPIAILTGGESAEQEIARQSAGNVAKFLAGRYQITIFDFPKEIDSFLARRVEFKVVIPVFHGRGGEDGTVQGFLETLKIPYLFSGVTAHAVGMDKDLAKRLMSTVGIKTPAWRVVTKNTPRESLSPNFPCVVKPVDGGSTQGVKIVRSAGEFTSVLDEALAHCARVMVEDCIVGDEFTVAVIDEGEKTLAMPVIQIKPANGLYDYDSKYGLNPAEKLCPAPISDELSRRLQETAVLVHQTLGARHLTRSDYFVDKDGVIWFLEVNTIPGLSVLFPRAVAASGRDFGDLLVGWVESC